MPCNDRKALLFRQIFDAFPAIVIRLRKLFRGLVGATGRRVGMRIGWCAGHAISLVIRTVENA
ncbi:hypothetical protein CA234_20050 [Sphingomonas sp. ABOLE]|nr:hypothetical protein CA234_20050 [Sphingomonas sp. ABOLE]